MVLQVTEGDAHSNEASNKEGKLQTCEGTACVQTVQSVTVSAWGTSTGTYA